MICFIIIGKNEGHKLVNCINSIKKTIAENKIGDYEIIYVDSKSTDNSIELVGGLDEKLKIFRISGKTNPAIGRNVGAAESDADIYCFIDGDMELVPDFFPQVLDDAGKLMAKGTRFALCRCGASLNAPACDNSHFRIMFSAPVTLPDSTPADTDIPASSVLSVKMQPGGPLLLTGPFTLVTRDGQELHNEGRTLLCACGKSSKKPFCDGSHSRKQ